MKLEYQIIELARGDRWNCNFCPFKKNDISIATHEIVSRKTGGYNDIARICIECKKDFDNDSLPYCNDCGRVMRNRITVSVI